MLIDWLGVALLAEIDLKNAEENDRGLCASHDHCDANMAMLKAYRNVHEGADMDLLDPTVQMAWEIAKVRGFAPRPVRFWRHTPRMDGMICAFYVDPDKEIEGGLMDHAFMPESPPAFWTETDILDALDTYDRWALADEARTMTKITTTRQIVSNHFDWFDRKVAEVRPEVRALVDPAGLTAYHSGGGCLVWHMEKEDGRFVMLCADDAGIDGDPAAEDWIVTVKYHDKAANKYHGCINAHDLVTLPRALEIMAYILEKVPAKGPWREVMKEADFTHDFDGLNDPA